MKRIVLLLALVLIAAKSFATIPCVLIRWDETRTNFTVANYNYNPEFLPVIGLIESLEVLIKRYPYTVPSYDPRLKILITEKYASDDYDLEHTENRMWIESYSLIDRSIQDKITSVEEAEANVNYRVMPTNRQLKMLLLYSVISRREAQGLTVTPMQQRILDKVEAYGLKIWNNHTIGESKKLLIEDGQEVDLDSDWKNEEPAE